MQVAFVISLQHVLSYNDYYTFGSLVPNRYGSIDSYRYGFNGKEKDDEVMGEGNFEDYGMRMYNPRIARFFNVDPLTRKFPMLTPYQFASNTPIQAIDLDGLEAYIVYNKATSTLAIIPNLSKVNSKLAYKFVSASTYAKLSIKEKSKYNYGIRVENVFTGGHSSEEGQRSTIIYDDPGRPREKPISTGIYSILENKGNTDPNHDSFFVLDPQDSSQYDKVDDRPGELNSDGEKRTGYNLHPGRVSWGCVTLCKDDPNMTVEERAEEWNIVNQAINNTKTEEVPDRRGKRKYIPFTTQIKYGELEVIDEKPTPPKPANKKKIKT